MALQHAGLLHLPPELLHQICSHISPDSPERAETFPEPHHLYYRAQWSLAALCLCSKIFSEIARPHLYHTILVDPKEFPLLMKTFLRRPLGSLVRHLLIATDVSAYEEHSEDYGAVEDQELLALLESLGTKPHSFRQYFNLLSPLLQQMKGLEILVMEDIWVTEIDAPAPELTKLSKMRLEVGETWQPIPIGTLISGLLQRAPCLSTLDIKGYFQLKGNGNPDVYRSVTQLKLTGVEYVWESVVDLLQACVNLTDLTLVYDEYFFGEGDPLFYDKLQAIIQPRRQSLLSLSLEPSDGTFRTETILYDRVDVSSSLKHLSISTSFFARRDTTVSSLLDNLPPSLQVLDIRKEYDIVNPKIVELVKRHHRERLYPELKELRLRIPKYVSLQKDRGVVPELAAACAEAEIKLSVTTVKDICQENRPCRCDFHPEG